MNFYLNGYDFFKLMIDGHPNVTFWEPPKMPKPENPV